MFLSGHFEETATLHSIAIAHESARARLESSVAFLTSVVVAEGREKGTEQLKEGRKGRAGERRWPRCCQLHAAGRGKQVGLSKAFIPFCAEFPESSEEGELVSSAALPHRSWTVSQLLATTWGFP